MSSVFKELYEAEHVKLMAVARKEKETSLLLRQAYKALCSELLEHDLLWDTRNLIDNIEKYIHERHV